MTRLYWPVRTYVTQHKRWELAKFSTVDISACWRRDFFYYTLIIISITKDCIIPPPNTHGTNMWPLSVQKGLIYIPAWGAFGRDPVWTRSWPDTSTQYVLLVHIGQPSLPSFYIKGFHCPAHCIWHSAFHDFKN